MFLTSWKNSGPCNGLAGVSLVKPCQTKEQGKRRRAVPEMGHLTMMSVTWGLLQVGRAEAKLVRNPGGLGCKEGRGRAANGQPDFPKCRSVFECQVMVIVIRVGNGNINLSYSQNQGFGRMAGLRPAAEGTMISYHIRQPASLGCENTFECYDGLAESASL